MTDLITFAEKVLPWMMLAVPLVLVLDWFRDYFKY